MQTIITTAATLRAQDAPVSSGPGQCLLLDRGWRFFQGDIPFPVITGHQPSYNNAKAGSAGGAAAVDYDDSIWSIVDLPHDWAIYTPIDEQANLAQGFHTRGIGWYRRTFKLDRADQGRHLALRFDGVVTHCTVWVNGIPVHRNWCGYTGFEIDITPFARFGDDTNVVAVRVDADAQEGWWYEGAGIYRHTWLVKRDATHIATDGVFAQPVRDEKGGWSIPVEVALNSSATKPENVSAEVTLIDPDGKSIATGHADATATPFTDAFARLTLTTEKPRLWSVDQPTLYTVQTDLKRDGKVIDSVTTRCGFRTIRFDAATGFYLNDQHLKLQGVCCHEDNAGVGVAVPDSIWDYRIRKLKETGVNAYRCSHNPPAAEFLEAADRLGLLVMDENRNFNTSPEYVRQLQWMVRRDRNHPSVMLWSIFNEEPFQGSEQGYQMVREMAAFVKQLDITRPVTAAQSGGLLAPVNASLAADVAGFNYQIGDYDRYHKAHPDKPCTSSEDTSAVMTRGEYVTDKHTRFVIDSYDDQWQPWGQNHRDAWKAIDTRPFMAGGFVWTGFDYRGEPQPLGWPATGSSFGIMDQCGFPKAAYWIHQAMWIKDKPILHLVPHWNWPDRVGQKIKVMGLSNADEIELSLNGKSIARSKVDPYEMVSWDVPYEPGKLEAVAFKDGKEVARFAEETTGDPVALKLVPDRNAIAGDGEDAVPVAVEAVDAAGRVVPTAKPFATFTVRGGGKIIGVGNGDPICHEPDKASSRSLYNGLAQLIVQSTGSTEPIVITAKADGLTAVSETIALTPATPRPFVPAPTAPQQLIRRWRMSPVTDKSPDPNQQISKNDMNTWTRIDAGKLVPMTGGSFAVLRSSIKPRASVAAAGGKIVFGDFTGKASVYIDQKLAGEKADGKAAPFSVDLPPGDREHEISVLLEAPAGSSAGLGGIVELTEK